jgi:hypothetical protein
VSGSVLWLRGISTSGENVDRMAYLWGIRTEQAG